MDRLEHWYVLYYCLAAISLVLGIWWGHVITLRSWVSWWGDVAPFLRETIRQVVREELERKEGGK